MNYFGRELTYEEKRLEDKLWHERIQYLWTKDEEDLTEDQEEVKKRLAEYNHWYYENVRKKNHPPKNKEKDMSEAAVRTRKWQENNRNRLCSYLGETVKWGTLMARFHNKYGYSWPDAKKMADESLIN